MTPQNIAKKGILLNTVLILATLAAFITIRVTNYMAESGYAYSIDFWLLFDIQRYTFIALAVISGIVLILSALLFVKSGKQAKGFIFLLISSAIALVLAIFGFVLGIITWILSAISINQFRQMRAESNFESKLNTMNIAHEYVPQNQVDNTNEDMNNNGFNNENGEMDKSVGSENTGNE
ncbi:MAG: hypothetical protein SPI74_07575 [Eubacterium sp.]|nr:hypothetical protein [Eubacterium sp.]